jgi:TPR repeat protein
MLGAHYLEGMPPLKQDIKKGLELLNQASELGLKAAHHTLGCFYAFGQNGVKEDNQKALYHLRLAAIGGMLESRYLLGGVYRRRNPKLAYKHFLIAAEAGHDESLEEVKTGYAEGHVEKDIFEKVLRAHQAAKNEERSEARDKAAEWYRRQSAGKK